MSSIPAARAVDTGAAPTRFYRWIVLRAMSVAALRQLLRLRLHRSARAAAQPPAALLGFADRFAAGGLQFRTSSRCSSAAWSSIGSARRSRWRCSASRVAASRSPRSARVSASWRGTACSWVRRRGAGARVERRRRALVLARRSEPRLRHPVDLPAARVADAPRFRRHGRRRRVHLLAMAAAASAFGFGGFCLVGAALYWMLDTRGERRFTLGHIAGERDSPVRRTVPVRPLVLDDLRRSASRSTAASSHSRRSGRSS